VIVRTFLETTEGQQPAGNRATAPQEQASRPVPGVLRRIASGGAPGGKHPPVHPDVAGPQAVQFLLFLRAARLGLG
jgi:hypothetical protein